jgi:hypothetical protein
MQGLRIGISCLTLLAGVAAVSLPANAVPAGDPSVCAMKADGPKWYPTAMLAKKDGARIMHPGDCKALTCTGMWPKVALYVGNSMGITPTTPICGMDPLTHARMTYPNQCAIESAGGTWIHEGPCK